MSVKTYNLSHSNVRASQCGMTLMSLLVSINLSMLAMLAALNMYSNHRLSANEATQGAEYTSQLMHTRLVIEKELTNAGFGIANSTTPNVWINSVGDNSDQLRWKYHDGNTVCRGIHENEVTIDHKTYRELAFVQATGVPCSTVGNLQTMVWVPVGILGRWPLNDELNAYVAANDSLFQFDLNTVAGNCSPFGATPTQQRQSVTVTAPSFPELNLLAEDSTYTPPFNSAFTVCLPN